MPNTTGISSEIYVSRDKIRNQIIDYLKEHLELENVDLTKSSFLSYIINLMSTLTSNLLFYQSSVYKEFYLTTAQLPESVFNLAAFLGYNVGTARYATSNALMTVPFGFSSTEVEFTIPEGFKFYANDIVFRTYYKTIVKVTNNSNVRITLKEDVQTDAGVVPKVYDIPVNIDTTADNEFSFLLPVRQVRNEVQEFQIDSDLKKFQFTNINVPITGKLSDISVEVRPPDSTLWQTYTYYSSLYLMDANTYGFTYQRTTNGIILFFGNGLMGIQPSPSSTVRVTAGVTEGSEGNVIAGSIKNGDRIYVTDGEETTILNYTVVNVNPARGGEDEESLEEVRSNAINSIKSMGRLVSKDDYNNMNELLEKYLENTFLIKSVYPLLKRSDLKVNEINLYMTILYANELVKTRSIHTSFPESENYIPRGSRLEFDGNYYVTLFDITIDRLNKAAYYEYVINQVENTPLLTRTYDIEYDITANNLIVSKELDDVIFKLEYRTSEPDFDQCTAEVEIVETGDIYQMTNDDSNRQFILNISPYTKVPLGDLNYNFTITSPDGVVGTYSSNVMVRQDLRKIMQSDAVIEDSTSIIVYDIPVIAESYYDQLDLTDFESTINQEVIRAFYTLDEYRMLTDFINMKYVNTHGMLYGMLNNEPTERSVIGFVDNEPTGVDKGDRYIINNEEIITCTDSTALEFYYYQPTSNEIAYVESYGQIYIFNGSEWISPIYNMPLQLDLEIFLESGVTQSVVEITNQVKTRLLDSFSNRFGPNATIYRSEIIRSVQELEFVNHCDLIRPKTNIFFEFSEENMTQTELLEFVPDYVYFDSDSINIKVL